VEQQRIVKGKKDKSLELITEPNAIGEHIQGWMLVKRAEGDALVEERFRTQVNLQYNRDLREFLNQNGLEANPRTDTNSVGSLLMSFLPIGLFLVVLYFLFRQQIRMAGRGAMSFGKSKAKMMTREKNRVTFKDVAGVEEAKDEVQEIVEFLKDPKKFQKLGGHIPKGVLMVGSPGTGKTLLARAIAGEADVPFFSISGSDFVEMFVGVGASRVRDMFEQGKKSAPCLIFIDEIDAVGRHRGHGMGGGHDEREQTLNALLVEMDGFDTQEGVIIIAATNRPDVLDPALLRPGRFDRQITVQLPDMKGREEILRVHSKKVKVADDVEWAVIARGTPGYSGAELANVINEAALLAARRGLKAITRLELEEARDKVRWGKERRSLAMSDKEKENTAYHEAGHALLGVLLKHTDPVHKVTIIPRGPSLGSTMYLPLEDKYTQRKNELLDRLVMIMGGRVAEEIVFGDVTNGARGDINQATGIARRMVCEWGMSEKMGMVEYGKNEEYVFLGRDISQSRNYSEATAQEIDNEVRALCDNAYRIALDLIGQNRDKLETIANGLLEFETLDGSHVREIMETGRIQNPPAPPPSPNVPPPLRPRTAGPSQEPELPPGLAGLPASA
jgi:cell division protease FtsH